MEEDKRQGFSKRGIGGRRCYKSADQMSFLLENTRRIFICFTAVETETELEREKKGIKGELPGIKRKQSESKNGGRVVGLCSAVLVALLPLHCLAELRWPRAILEQIRLPLCVHYVLLTFAKRWSSWPWEIDEGPKMSLYLPGPFMLPWEQRLCVCACMCECARKRTRVERGEGEKTMWLLFSWNPPELCFWQLKVKVIALFFSHCCCLLFWENGHRNTVLFLVATHWKCPPIDFHLSAR